MAGLADDNREWLEADGLGGFASGTVNLVRTRRYHGLLLCATTPPTGRVMLVNGFDAWVEIAGRRAAISSQRYVPDVVHPDGAAAIESFATDPWPTWTYRIAPDLAVQQEIFVPHGRPCTVVTWRLVGTPAAERPVHLAVRPFLSSRDYHSTHHENGACITDGHVDGETVRWQLYAGHPAVVSRSNGRYEHAPDWYRRFLYTAEQDRGLDAVEDLLSPGWLTWDLAGGDAIWILEAGSAGEPSDVEAQIVASRLRTVERTRRTSFVSPLHRAADAYLVKRGQGRTIVAGYPWFTDWGRDTFIALRGLCLSTGRANDAAGILKEWAGVVSEGMLPNRFPDGDSSPEYNAVDASLWFVIAVRDLIDAADRGDASVGARDRVCLLDAVNRILEGYSRGTRYGIRADQDGLLACGVPGVQLTWMDARVGDEVITPRIGKPVEVQALWLASLAFGARFDPRWQLAYLRAHLSFGQRFWNEERQCLYDVVDVDHVPGRVDGRVRPNQVLAVGGLGAVLVDPDRARLVVSAVERELLTPCGLRTLARGEPGYTAHYRGGPAERDRSYHQGTAWPWLAGPFVEAWLAVHGQSADARREARERFVAPLLAHLDEAGLGHVSEIADADAPFTPAGCPFQAWSLGELLRALALVKAPGERRSDRVSGWRRQARTVEPVP